MTLNEAIVEASSKSIYLRVVYIYKLNNSNEYAVSLWIDIPYPKREHVLFRVVKEHYFYLFTKKDFDEMEELILIK